MKIKSQLLRAAQVCQATKDVRYYLNAIHIHSNKVESTNGHVCIQMEMDRKVRGHYLFDIKNRVPVKAEWSKFEFNGKDSLVKHYDTLGTMISCSPVEIVDGRFPDLEKVMPTEFNECKSMAFNPDYLVMSQKIFGSSNGVRIQFSDKKALMTPFSDYINEKLGNPKFVVMSLRD